MTTTDTPSRAVRIVTEVCSPALLPLPSPGTPLGGAAAPLPRLDGGRLGILLFGHAPGDVIALDVAMLVTLFACTIVTRWWKISLHSAVAGGAVATFALLLTALSCSSGGPGLRCGITRSLR